MKHNTTGGYNKGCRCDGCRAAKSEANRKMRFKMTQNKDGSDMTLFEMGLRVLSLIVSSDKRLSSSEISESLELNKRQVNKILCDFVGMGLIESGFNITGFQKGDYVYNATKKAFDILGFRERL